ncbi:hypothetical protein [Thiocystis minor]|uniref:hypothetical protein n=1 Tax=Thiocystis minor TaxID=61597 RepID=UPI0019125CD0|nr:hypothetical protein [Thiocystis minor]
MMIVVVIRFDNDNESKSPDKAHAPSGHVIFREFPNRPASRRAPFRSILNPAVVAILKRMGCVDPLSATPYTARSVNGVLTPLKTISCNSRGLSRPKGF